MFASENWLAQNAAVFEWPYGLTNKQADGIVNYANEGVGTYDETQTGLALGAGRAV
jgi:hypothetical protein